METGMKSAREDARRTDGNRGEKGAREDAGAGKG